MHRSISLVAAGFFLVTLLGCGELRELRRQNASLKASLHTAELARNQFRDSASLLEQENAGLAGKLAKAQASESTLTGLLGKLEQAQLERQKQLAELKDLVATITGMDAVQGPEGTIIRMENQILFASGKADLTPEAQQTLDGTLVAYMRKHAGQKIRIDGHTDGQPIKVSPYDDNFHLAFMRANAVRRYLVSKDVAVEDMYAVAFGPNRPRVPPVEPMADMPENRRVEILVVPPAGKSMEEILDEFVK